MKNNFNISDIASKGRAYLYGDSLEINGFSIDTRTLLNGDLYIALKGENFDGHNFVNEAITKGAKAVVSDHYFESRVPLLVVDNTEDFLKNLAIMNRVDFEGPVIGITGSNGKTSSKEIVASLLSKKRCHKTIGNKNNHIGLPFSLADLDNTYDCSILELGTSFPGEIGLLRDIAKPDIALITNVSESHLTGLGSLDLIAKEKGDIGCFESNEGVLVLNKDSTYFDLWKETTNANKVISFGTKEGCDFQVTSTDINFKKNQTSFVLVHENEETDCSIKGVGVHNAVNAAGALAVCSSMGLVLDEIVDNLQLVELPQRRLSPFRLSNGSLLIDDSYNANPESVKQSIDTLFISGINKKVMVLGEMGELGKDSAKLHKRVCEYAKTKVDSFLCIGDSWKEGVRLFGEKGILFSSQEQLIDHVSSTLETDTVILVKGSRSTRMDIVADKLKEF
jgi:UDP-N-acetylmuramoyl-tripeptide--D-alanyl-D-alanine ligase